MKIIGFKQIIKNKIANFDSGAKINNDQYHYVRFRPGYEYETDAFIQFNIYNPYRTYNRDIKKQAYQYIINSEKPFLVCEEGFFRQFPNYKRYGWYNYKNDLGIFNNRNVDNKRWIKFKNETGIKIKDWNSPGDNILIIGQVDKDSSLIELYDHGYKSFNQFIIEKIKEIRQYSDRPIVIRPHPQSNSIFYQIEDSLNKNYRNVSISKNYKSDTVLSGGQGLKKDLRDSYCVITYNSNTAAEALEEGIPFFTLSFTSAAYNIGHKNLRNIENLNYNIDIDNWCNKISYTFWNQKEVESGEMWENLKNEIV